MPPLIFFVPPLIFWDFMWFFCDFGGFFDIFGGFCWIIRTFFLKKLVAPFIYFSKTCRPVYFFFQKFVAPYNNIFWGISWNFSQNTSRYPQNPTKSKKLPKIIIDLNKSPRITKTPLKIKKKSKKLHKIPKKFPINPQILKHP